MQEVSFSAQPEPLAHCIDVLVGMTQADLLFEDKYALAGLFIPSVSGC